MSLNVNEIEAHEFATVKRGYDPDQVRSYLREVAISLKDTPGRAYGDVGERVASVFESADKAANEIMEAAEREAEAMQTRTATTSAARPTTTRRRSGPTPTANARI